MGLPSKDDISLLMTFPISHGRGDSFPSWSTSNSEVTRISGMNWSLTYLKESGLAVIRALICEAAVAVALLVVDAVSAEREQLVLRNECRLCLADDAAGGEQHHDGERDDFSLHSLYKYYI